MWVLVRGIGTFPLFLFHLGHVRNRTHHPSTLLLKEVLMDNLRIAIFSENSHVTVQLETWIAERRGLTLVRHNYRGYPKDEEIKDFLEVQAPSVLLIDTDCGQEATRL